MKTLFASALLVFAACAFSQDKAPDKPKREPQKKTSGGTPVMQIERTGPPPCIVKPVMTDEEIEICRRASYAPRPKPKAPEIGR
jgi:hypothetical protein